MLEKMGAFFEARLDGYDEHMRTNIAGVFAAGDVTGEPYQIARAIGQGNVAALSIASYFAEMDKA